MTMQERYLALTEKRKIPEVIVVEGKDDTANLRRFYEGTFLPFANSVNST